MAKESKLMSYITSDFTSKSDMVVGHAEWQRIIGEMAQQFAAAGAIRQTVSQIWNKDGVFRIGNMWEYRDEKAFVECQHLFREAEKRMQDECGIPSKVFANRGVILTDVYF